jgi:mannitol/fructose-specific phosphotransferase system IIA component (Ntr-type)
VQKLLRAGAIVLELPASTRRDAIVQMATVLAERTGRPEDARRFADAVLAREETAGTGVGDGVAFPHADVEGLTEPALAFARSKQGLDFDAPDGAPAKLVFMLLTPRLDYERSLRLLAGMARLLARDEVRERLLAAGNNAAVVAALSDPGAPPPSSTPIPGSGRMPDSKRV